MAYRSDTDDLTFAEAIEQLNLETLRPLAQLLDRDAPARKRDIVPYLTQRLAREDMVRRLYESLGHLGQAAVQEALDDPLGQLDPVRFQAKYGRMPDAGGWKSPKVLRLLM